MGPCGSVGAHIKAGKRYMVQDHFKTPPDPQKGSWNDQKIRKKVKNLPELAKNLSPAVLEVRRGMMGT